MSQTQGEFDLIRRCFASGFPLGSDVLLGVGDDCSAVRPPAGYDLVQSIDTQVADVHFPHNAPAHLIAGRALRCAASDLAAMGAAPQGFHLALTLPDSNPAWLDQFAYGLRTTAHDLGLPLLGGDTTRGPLLIITISVQGWVPQGKMLTRHTAKAGDELWVSNTIGSAALALPDVLKNPASELGLAKAYYHPSIQFTLGQRLVGIASACMDISDGLLQDAGHIARASQVAIEINADQVPTPVSSDHPHWQTCLSGGDDYQLLFSAAPERHNDILALNSLAGVNCTCIGRITAADARQGSLKNAGVSVLKDGQPFSPQATGYQHF